MKLKDKVSLVTGASRGIGRAIAITFAREGSDVIVNYMRNRDAAEEVVEEIQKIGRRAISVKADVANKGEVNRMVDEGFKEFDKIDVLVNNAGHAVKPPSALEITPEEWERMMGVHLYGSYYCVQTVAPRMIENRYGKIVNMSSIAGLGKEDNEVTYSIAKSAIVMLTKKLAYALGEHNINVNAIAPGLIKTDLFSSLVGSEELIQKRIEEKSAVTSLRRIGATQDIANTALFLVSDESKFITGQLIVVDGGRFDMFTHSL